MPGARRKMLTVRLSFAALLVCAVAPLYAQLSPIFPGRAVTDADMGIRSDTCQTNLAQQIGPTDTQIIVNSTSGCPAANFIAEILDKGIFSEQVFVSSVLGTTWTVAARGFNNTTPIGHIAGVPVYGPEVAYHRNRDAAEIESLESYVLTHGGGGGGINYPSCNGIVISATTAWGTCLTLPLGSLYGGTGIDNGSNTLTLNGSLSISGSFNPSVFVLPVSGTWTWPVPGSLIGSADVGTVTNAMLLGSIATSKLASVGTAANNLVQLNGSAQLPAVSAALLTNFPTLNQNTNGTAANLSGTPALPNGTTATTQAFGDTTTALATDAFAAAAATQNGTIIYCSGTAGTDCTTTINGCLQTQPFCTLSGIASVATPITCTALSFGANPSGVLLKLPGAVLNCADPPGDGFLHYTIDWTNPNLIPQWFQNATVINKPQFQPCNTAGTICGIFTYLGLFLPENFTAGNCGTGLDGFWANQATHQMYICNNGNPSVPLPGGGGLATNLSTGSIGVTPTTVATLAILSNTISQKTTYLLTAEGTITNSSATSYTTNFVLNFGSTGTPSDTAVLTVAPSSAATAASVNVFLTCRLAFKSTSTANAACIIQPSSSLLTNTSFPATGISSSITGLVTNALSYVQLSFSTSNANIVGAFSIANIDMEHP